MCGGFYASHGVLAVMNEMLDEMDPTEKLPICVVNKDVEWRGGFWKDLGMSGMKEHPLQRGMKVLFSPPLAPTEQN